VTQSTTSTIHPMPARRNGESAEVRDIVTTQWSSSGALWEVESIDQEPSYFGSRTKRKVLNVRSLTSNRTDRRSASQMQVLSPEEAARVQAKRQERTLKLTPEEAAALLELLVNEPIGDDEVELTSVFEKLAEIQKKAAA